MKQTVFKSIVERLYDGFFNKEEEKNYIELEKQQLKETWIAAEENMRRQFSSSTYNPLTFEEYYNE